MTELSDEDVQIVDEQLELIAEHRGFLLAADVLRKANQYRQWYHSSTQGPANLAMADYLEALPWPLPPAGEQL